MSKNGPPFKLVHEILPSLASISKSRRILTFAPTNASGIRWYRGLAMSPTNSLVKNNLTPAAMAASIMRRDASYCVALPVTQFTIASWLWNADSRDAEEV